MRKKLLGVAAVSGKLVIGHVLVIDLRLGSLSLKQLSFLYLVEMAIICPLFYNSLFFRKWT